MAHVELTCVQPYLELPRTADATFALLPARSFSVAWWCQSALAVLSQGNHTFSVPQLQLDWKPPGHRPYPYNTPKISNPLPMCCTSHERNCLLSHLSQCPSLDSRVTHIHHTGPRPVAYWAWQQDTGASRMQQYATECNP